ncbi:MAG: hypothetical protein QM638_04180 [Nocardioides sp.]|uniref:hypothetical protein n=1 Tax=Nocardioides sp. TaxID=35761 RepID=UPI0039E273D9
MVADTARCAVHRSQLTEYADLPEVPNPPACLEPQNRPACCRNISGNMVLNIDLEAFKTHQHDLMVGSFERTDWSTGPRSANERHNSLLNWAHSGANLSRRSMAPRKTAFYALTLDASIAVTNVRVIEILEAKANTHDGVVIAPPGKTNKRQWEATLASLPGPAASRLDEITTAAATTKRPTPLKSWTPRRVTRQR